MCNLQLEEMADDVHENAANYNNGTNASVTVTNNGYVNGITWEHPTPNTSSVRDFPSFGAPDMVNNSADGQGSNNAWRVYRRH